MARVRGWLPSKRRQWLIILLLIVGCGILGVAKAGCAVWRVRLQEADRAISQVRQDEEVPASFLEQRDRARAVLEIQCTPKERDLFTVRPWGP